MANKLVLLTGQGRGRKGSVSSLERQVGPNYRIEVGNEWLLGLVLM